jgi:RNA polymerase sigma-70 factor (ECF subfamily)
MPGQHNQRFRTLVEPHLEALFRAAYRLTRNTADAEDLVQETCVRACVRLETLREAGPVKAWLLRVMHNLFIDDTRRARLSPIDPAGNAAEHAEATASPAPTPEESLQHAQSAAQLERAWQQLDRGHRALLALRAEGYTLPEISRITHIAMDALTMRLYRARQSLTRCLRDQQVPSNVIPMEASK